MASYRWVDGTTATVPDARNSDLTVGGGTFAYNTDTDRVVEWAFTQSRTKTWERYSGDWHQVNPVLSPPTVLFSPNGVGMAYDDVRNEIVLSVEPSATAAMETWTWDSTNWTLKTPLTIPTSSGQPQGTDWDPVNNATIMVLYLAGVMKVWSWDGTNWTLLTIAGTPPTARTRFAFAYFPPGGYFLFQGGQSPASNDTWALDITAGTWTQLTPTHSPPNTSTGYMAYNPLWGKMVFYNSGGETWLWDGTNWEQILPSPDVPQRAEFHLCFNSAEGRIMGYGGVVSGPAFSYETWFLERVQQSAVQVIRWW